MTVTILALIFLLIMLVTAYFGYRFLGRREPVDGRVVQERCTICRNHYPTSALIERQVGDSRVYRFCEACIKSLQTELTQRN